MAGSKRADRFRSSPPGGAQHAISPPNRRKSAIPCRGCWSQIILSHGFHTHTECAPFEKADRFGSSPPPPAANCENGPKPVQTVVLCQELWNQRQFADKAYHVGHTARGMPAPFCHSAALPEGAREIDREEHPQTGQEDCGGGIRHRAPCRYARDPAEHHPGSQKRSLHLRRDARSGSRASLRGRLNRPPRRWTLTD